MQTLQTAANDHSTGTLELLELYPGRKLHGT